MDFKERNREVEWMDGPEVDKAMLSAVLADINNANHLLNGNSPTLRSLAALIREHPKERYVILDMGCGDGCMLRKVARFGRKNGIPLQCIGLDLNEEALQIARSHARDYPEICFLKQDIMALTPSSLQCDILLCTLTMHHFRNEQIPIFLDQFVKLAHIGIVINDLQRSRLAYYLFQGFSTIFIKTRMAKHDGLISIRSGFSKAELLAFSKALPNMSHRIRWKWAFRFVWVIRTGRLS